MSDEYVRVSRPVINQAIRQGKLITSDVARRTVARKGTVGRPRVEYWVSEAQAVKLGLQPPAPAGPVTASLVPFSFQGDKLDVATTAKGVFVSIRRVCEALGVDFSSQLVKLREDSVVGVVIITTPSGGGAQETACIELRSLPLWLATIHPGRVRPEVAVKLIAYKRECAEVLADHFLGPRGRPAELPAPPRPVEDPALAARMTRLEADVAALRRPSLEERKNAFLAGLRVNVAESDYGAGFRFFAL